MKTILMATGESTCLKGITQTMPSPMVPLVDRPCIQHVVEFLTGQGKRDIDVVLFHLPHQIESFLGDGSRWGCRIVYHLARDLMGIARLIKTIAGSTDAPVLLADATTIPQADISDDALRSLGTDRPVFYCEKNGACEPGRNSAWTGWAWLPPDLIHRLPPDTSLKDLFSWADTRLNGSCSVVWVPRAIRMDTYEGVLSSNALVLDKKFNGLLMTGREADDGVWLSRNVVMYPGASITPPVFIGPNCRIGRSVRLGPHAVIGRNCVLDDGSAVSNAVVFPNTYVGPSLDLNDVIVNRNRLINVRMGSETTITDEFILSGIREEHMRKWLSGVFSRIFALIFLALAVPPAVLVYPCLLAVYRALNVKKTMVISLPAEYDPILWKAYPLISLECNAAGRRPTWFESRETLAHFLFRFLPGLINVVRGELQIVGVQPRSAEEIESLQPEWKITYLRSKAGLITESFVNFGERASEHEVYSAEMLYSTTFTRKKDLDLLLRYFGRLGREIFSTKRRAA